MNIEDEIFETLTKKELDSFLKAIEESIKEQDEIKEEEINGN